MSKLTQMRTKKPRYGFEERVELDPQAAWEIFKALPNGTVMDFARDLKERGVKISYDTVARWARRGRWRERRSRLRTFGHPEVLHFILLGFPRRYTAFCVSESLGTRKREKPTRGSSDSWKRHSGKILGLL